MLIDTTIASLEPNSNLVFDYDYSSNFDDGYGNMQFEIDIDSILGFERISFFS